MPEERTPDYDRRFKDLERRIELIEEWRTEKAGPEIASQAILVNRAVDDLDKVRNAMDKFADQLRGNFRWIVGLVITAIIVNGVVSWLHK